MTESYEKRNEVFIWWRSPADGPALQLLLNTFKVIQFSAVVPVVGTRQPSSRRSAAIAASSGPAVQVVQKAVAAPQRLDSRREVASCNAADSSRITFPPDHRRKNARKPKVFRGKDEDRSLVPQGSILEPVS